MASINDKKEHVFESDFDTANKTYNAYIVNMNYSYGMDTILYANEMNIRSGINNRMQYDFYFHGISKARRFNKFLKPKVVENIEAVLEYYDCSDKKAKEIIDVLTQEQIETIKTRLYKGETINDKPRTRKK